jgi:hypothetical protein
MKLSVVITTCNRAALLKRLLTQVCEMKPVECAMDIHVFDDCSEDETPMVAATAGAPVWYVRYPKRRGKRGFYKTYNDALKRLATHQADFYYFLQDDNFLCRDFFRVTMDYWNAIQDSQRGIMMLRLDGRHERRENVYDTGRPLLTVWKNIEFMCCKWVECVFMTDASIFHILPNGVPQPDERWWKENPNASSGVAKAIAMGMRRSRKTAYYPLVSFTKEDETKSVMHDHRPPMKTWRFYDDQYSLLGHIPQTARPT